MSRFLLLALALLVFDSPPSAQAASFFFNKVYAGTGTNYAIQTSSIQITSPLAGAGFTFTSANPNDMGFTVSGNNTAGYITYVNASGVSVSVEGGISRRKKVSQDNLAFYFFGTGADVGKGFLIVDPENETSITGNQNVSTDSSPYIDDLEGIRFAQDESLKISVDGVTVSEASPYAVVSVNLSYQFAFPMTFTPVLFSGTATVGADVGNASLMQYFNGTNWVSASGGVILPANQTTVLVRVPVTNDSALELSESLTFSTGPVSGSAQVEGALVNRSGAFNAITIVDNGTVSSVFEATNNTSTATIGIPDNDAPPNQVPSFVLRTNAVSVGEDAGAYGGGANFVTNILAGPVDESWQRVTLTVTNDNSALFRVQPALSTNGTLTFSPATNASGTATVTVVAKDNGGTARGGVDTSEPQTFTITITPVNDPPVLAVIPAQTTPEETPLNVTLTAVDPENDSLTYTASSANTNVTVSITNNVITLTPATNWTGSVTITATVTDTGGLSHTRTFTLTVTQVNDAPVLAAIPDQTTLEDTPKVVSLSAADLDGDSLNYIPSVLSGSVNTSVSGSNLTLTPGVDWNGTASIRVTVIDSGTGRLTDSKTFTLTVTPVNDAPGFYVPSVTSTSAGQTWAARISGGWLDCAISADGLKMAAVNYGGQIYTSTNRGTNWTARATTGNWASIASSADGTKLVAARDNNRLATSTDSGVTWTDRESSRSWGIVGSSADGVVLAAYVNNGSIYTSWDSGVTWTNRTAAPGTGWVNISVSADGTTIVGVIYSGRIWVSRDSGVTWTARESNRTGWSGIGVSSDGSVMMATLASSPVYVSTDGGTNWAVRTAAGNRGWWSAADVSADGRTMAAGVYNGPMMISTDYGVSWTARATDASRSYRGVAISADGSTIVGAAQNGNLMVSVGAPGYNFTVTVAEDSGDYGPASAATNIVAGPADESGQSLAFAVTNNNAALFSVQPALAADGTLTFTPATNANGRATVSAVLQDNGGTNNGGMDTAAAQTFLIVVTPANDAPVLGVIAGQTTLEETALTVPLTSVDVEGNSVTYTASSSTNGVIVSISGTNVVLTPATNFTGTATISVTVTDSVGASSTRTFVLTVSPINDPPTFNVIASVTVNEDSGAYTRTNFATSIIPGPADERSQLLTVSISNTNTSLFSVQPALGTNGTLTFTPATNANGTTLVSVYMQDDGGTTNGGNDTSVIKTFIITINAVDDAPLATAQSVSTLEEVPLVITLAGTDVEGSALTYAIVTQPSGGTLSGSGASRTYTPGTNYNGTDSFTFRAIDGDAGSAPATVNITITPVNDAPEVALVTNNTVITVSAPIAITNFATFSPGPANESLQGLLSYTTTNDTPGMFSQQPAITNGTLTFTLLAPANGTSTVSLVTRDDAGTANGGVDSTTNFFFITADGVRVPNQRPSISFAATTVSVLEDSGAASFTNQAALLPGSSAESGQLALSYTVTVADASLFSVQPAISTNGTLTFTTATNAHGTSVVNVVVRDDGGTANYGVDTSLSQAFSIVVGPVNDSPGFSLGSNITVAEDSGAYVAGVYFATNRVAGPVNEAAQTFTFTATNNHNALFSVQPAFAPDGTLTFTPAADASGVATISVVMQDDGGTANGGVDTSAAQTFTITVTAVNDAPLLSVLPDRTTLEETALSVPLTAVDTESGLLTFTGTSSTNAVTVSISGTNAVVTPASNFVGTATITITVTDAGGLTHTRTFELTVSPINDPPGFDVIATVTVAEDSGPYTEANFGTNIVVGPSDELGQALTASISNDSPSLFSVQPLLGTDGTLTFTPAANANGTAIVSVVMQDDGGTANGGNDTSVTNTFTIIITAENDAPVLAVISDQATLEETPLTVPLTATDVEGDTLTYAVESSTNAVTVSISGTNVVIVPATNFVGTATITVTVTDSGGPPHARLFVLTVSPINDPPSFNVTPSVTVAEDSGPYTGTNFVTNIVPGPDDELGQLLVVSIANDSAALFSDQPALGTNGMLTFAPATNANGTATVSVIMQDDGGTANGGNDTSVTNTFTIIITPMNDAPTLGIIPDQTTPEETPLNVPLTATDIDGSSFTYSAIVSDTNVVVTVTGTNLVVTPGPDWNGVATVTVTVTDSGGLTHSRTFVFTVTPVNDPPTFDVIASVTVNEDSGAYSGTNFATNIVPGPADEYHQRLLVTISNNSPALFSVQPALGTNGLLTFTPAANSNGQATVSVFMQDNGGTDNGGNDTSVTKTFLIIIAPVNDAPRLGIFQPQTTPEETPLSVPLIAVDIEGNALTYSASSTNTNVTVSVVGTNLVITPGPNWNGEVTVTVTVTDSGGLTHTRPVTVTVTPVNDAPTLAIAIPDRPANYGSNFTYTVSTETFTDVDAGDTLTYGATGLPPGVTFNPGTRTFSGTPTAAGSYSVVVTVTDSGELTATDTFVINVAPAALIITAEAKTRAYGSTNPVFTVTYSGFVNSDVSGSVSNLTITTAATPLSPAGQYDIVPDGAQNANYSITHSNGVLTVGKAVLTVKADNITKNLGSPNPPLTASYTGFVNSEVLGTSGVTGAPDLSTTATQSSPFGSYPITISQGTLASANYSFTFTNGWLAVDNTPPENTVPADRQIVDANQPLTFSAAATNSVSVSDPDSPDLTVTLLVEHGTVTLSQLTGLTVLAGTGTNDAEVTVFGAQTNLNAALDGLIFRSVTNFAGLATVTMTTVDHGELVDEDVIDITVELVTLGGLPSQSIEALKDPDKVLSSVAVVTFDPDLVQRVDIVGTGAQQQVVVKPAGRQDGSVQRTTVRVRLDYTDNTSELVDIPVVIYNPELSVVRSIVGVASLNPQTSLYEQGVRVTNSTPYNFMALRIYVPSLPSTVRLQNVAGTNAQGAPYVQFIVPLPAGEERIFTLEYFSQRLRPFPDPELVLELQEQRTVLTPVGRYLAIDRIVVPTNGRVYLEFTMRTGTTNWIQYTDNLGAGWKTSPAPLIGTGYKMEWLDDGPPKTETRPLNGRMYRIVVTE